MRLRPDLRLAILAGPALIVAVTSVVKPPVATYIWRLFGVPALFPRFADTVVITSGWNCTRLGLDVLETNPCDPWSRTVNYPRVWLIPAQFGLGTASTEYLAVGMIVVFLISLFFVLGPLTPRKAAYYLAALLSFPLLLLIERGNIDLLAFALVVGAVALLVRGGRLGTGLGAALIVVATVLKLYPIAAMHALFLRLGGWQQSLTAIVALLAGAYAFVTWNDLQLVRAGTPNPTFAAYGVLAPIDVLIKDLKVSRVMDARLVEGAAEVIVLVGLIVSIAILIRRLGRLRSATTDMSMGDTFVGLLFSAGASIYVLTFLLGTNWDYRLVFLLLTMPQLFEWAAVPALSGEARIVLAALLVTLYLSAVTTYPLFFISQLLLYALFAYFASVLVIITLEHVKRWIPAMHTTTAP